MGRSFCYLLMLAGLFHMGWVTHHVYEIIEAGGQWHPAWPAFVGFVMVFYGLTWLNAHVIPLERARQHQTAMELYTLAYDACHNATRLSIADRKSVVQALKMALNAVERELIDIDIFRKVFVCDRGLPITNEIDKLMRESVLEVVQTSWNIQNLTSVQAQLRDWALRPQ